MSDGQCPDCGGYLGWEHLSGCRLATYDHRVSRRRDFLTPCYVCHAIPTEFAHFVSRGREIFLVSRALDAGRSAQDIATAVFSGTFLCRRDHMIFDIWTGVLDGDLFSSSKERLAQYRPRFERMREYREYQLATLRGS